MNRTVPLPVSSTNTPLQTCSLKCIRLLGVGLTRREQDEFMRGLTGIPLEEFQYNETAHNDELLLGPSEEPVGIHNLKKIHWQVDLFGHLNSGTFT
jgi:hypothetical protein